MRPRKGNIVSDRLQHRLAQLLWLAILSLLARGSSAESVMYPNVFIPVRVLACHHIEVRGSEARSPALTPSYMAGTGSNDRFEGTLLVLEPTAAPEPMPGGAFGDRLRSTWTLGKPVHVMTRQPVSVCPEHTHGLVIPDYLGCDTFPSRGACMAAGALKLPWVELLFLPGGVERARKMLADDPFALSDWSARQRTRP